MFEPQLSARRFGPGSDGAQRSGAKPAPIPNPLKPSLLRRLGRALQTLGQHALLDERTHYLSQSTSSADLEHRLRQWDDYTVRRRWEHWL